MSKYCPAYNCIVLYMDCLECEEKMCKYIVGRKLKIRPGDILDVKTIFGKEQRFMYIGVKQIDEYKSKRILYRFEDQKIIFVDSDFFKLKKAKKLYTDTGLKEHIKKEHKNEI